MNIGYIIRKAKREDLSAIRRLQEKNLFSKVSDTIKAKEGFVSLETDIPLLSKINRQIGIIVAEFNGKIVGYELPLPIPLAKKMPFLVPLVKRYMRLKFNRKPLLKYKTILEVQICIDKSHKGKGVAEKMHKAFLELLNGKYQLLVTEVSDLNQRSLKAHTQKLGLSVLETYSADEKKWYILVQEIS